MAQNAIGWRTTTTNLFRWGGMSKAYGLAGLRVGWLVSKDIDVLNRVVKIKHYMSICDSAPSEYLSKVALRHGDILLKRNTELIRKNMQIADRFFEKYDYLFEKKPISCGPVAFHKLLVDMPVKDFAKWP